MLSIAANESLFEELNIINIFLTKDIHIRGHCAYILTLFIGLLYRYLGRCFLFSLEDYLTLLTLRDAFVSLWQYRIST